MPVPTSSGTVTLLAEADGNRTRLTEMLGHVGFEDRGEHQLPERLPGVAPEGATPAASSIARIAGSTA